MTFDQQLNTLQNIIKAYDVHVPKTTRQMGSYEVHDLYFYAEGVNMYVCVNYTNKTVTWRNKDTGETVTK